MSGCGLLLFTSYSLQGWQGGAGGQGGQRQGEGGCVVLLSMPCMGHAGFLHSTAGGAGGCGGGAGGWATELITEARLLAGD